MILVTDYTTYAEVRAVLGVDEIELPDTTLALTMYSAALQRALRGFTDDAGESLATKFDAIDISEATEDEENLYYTIKEYATYVVAEVCCSGISMFALKSDSDGKAAQARFASEATFRDVVANVRQRLTSLVGILDRLLEVTVDSTITSITVVPPAIDKVTNA